MEDLKVETLKQAGFVTAHGIWVVSGGETLMPMGSAILADGKGPLCSFYDEDLETAVSMARSWLNGNLSEAKCAAIAIDGFITLDERVDAIVVEVRSYEEPVFSLTIATPYRPVKPAKGLGLFKKKQPFIVHRPKFMNMVGLDESDHAIIGEAFFSGIDQHEKGAAVWQAHYDESNSEVR